MRWVCMFAAVSACADPPPPKMVTLTQAQAQSVVDVTSQITQLLVTYQGSGTTTQSIPIDTAVPCTSGAGHITGTGVYAPEAGKDIGPTTFDVMITLDACADLSSPGLIAHGVVEDGASGNNITSRGPVTWSSMPDGCEMVMKWYNYTLSTYMGTICAFGVTPYTITDLPQ